MSAVVASIVLCLPAAHLHIAFMPADVVFGQLILGLLAGWNLVPEGNGVISVGDQVQVSKRRNGLEGLRKDD